MRQAKAWTRVYLVMVMGVALTIFSGCGSGSSSQPAGLTDDQKRQALDQEKQLEEAYKGKMPQPADISGQPGDSSKTKTKAAKQP